MPISVKDKKEVFHYNKKIAITSLKALYSLTQKIKLENRSLLILRFV